MLDIGQISAYDVFHHPNKSKLFAQIGTPTLEFTQICADQDGESDEEELQEDKESDKEGTEDIDKED